MNFVSLIEKKRNGFALSYEEIEYFAKGAATGEIPDYQLSAMLMAIYFNGLNDRETLELTLSMVNSGEVADLGSISGIKCDKHSTGGVGDKTTLVVAPIVAECGIKIAKMSGRGLGHTGGTVDKLESIPGFKASLTAKEFADNVNKCGLCVAGQSGNFCPADKKLYALRDVTATVENISLIASSIMSKKLAGGADCIVLDVKCGNGAFMKNEEDAQELAKKMVNIGTGAGKKIAALITDMDVPLGNKIGNSLEIEEAVETLKGKGPEDLTELCLSLCAKLLELSGKGDYEDCKKLAISKINNGSALNKLAEMIELQGGDKSYIYDTSKFKKSKFACKIISESDGYISEMDTSEIGNVCVILGAGRKKKDDAIDHSAGIVLNKKTGDKINKNEVIATLFCNDPELFSEASNKFARAVKISSEQPRKKPLIFKIIQ